MYCFYNDAVLKGWSWGYNLSCHKTCDVQCSVFCNCRLLWLIQACMAVMFITSCSCTVWRVWPIYAVPHWQGILYTPCFLRPRSSLTDPKRFLSFGYGWNTHLILYFLRSYNSWRRGTKVRQESHGGRCICVFILLRGLNYLGPECSISLDRLSRSNTTHALWTNVHNALPHCTGWWQLVACKYRSVRVGLR